MNTLYYDIITKYSNTNYSSLTESLQPRVANEIMDKLFVLTIGKYNKIDFSDISRSNGNITRLKFYKNLIESIKTLIEINNVTHNLNAVLTINKAIENVIKLKSSFEKSFRIKNNCGIMIYNLVCYSIMEATSYLIASAIDFVSENNVEEVKIYEGKELVLVDSLRKFNECAENGTIFKFISKAEEDMKSVKSTNEVVSPLALTIMISASVIIIAAAAIPFLREMAYQIYRTRHKISDSAEIQAALLECNIEMLKTKDGMTKVIARQEKWVKRFRSIAAKFALDSDKAKRDATMDMEKDKIEMNNIVL